MPITIVAIVIVIISKGIFKKPRLPNINIEATMSGAEAIKLNFQDLNNINKARRIPK